MIIIFILGVMSMRDIFLFNWCTRFDYTPYLKKHFFVNIKKILNNFKRLFF